MGVVTKLICGLTLLLIVNSSHGANLKKVNEALQSIMEDVKHLEEEIQKDQVGQSVNKSESSIEKRNAVRFREWLWTTRDIPYEFDNLRKSTIRDIEAAIKLLESKTCIRFHKRRDGDKTYMKFTKTTDRTCYAPVGHYFGSNDILIEGCGGGVGITLHEILHSLGFMHEFVRPDRDQYLEILWNNIRAPDRHLYTKVPAWEYQAFGTYDFDSVMNYRPSNKMRARNDPDGSKTARMRIAHTLSSLDVMKINKLYQCGEESTVHDGYTVWQEWSPCWIQGERYRRCRRNRQRYCFSEDVSKCTLSVSTRWPRIVTEIEDCEASQCVIDGQWTPWGRWGSCSLHCGGGVRSRKKECENPSPQNGGAACVGQDSEQGPCNEFPCYQHPVDGGCDFESFAGESCKDYRFPTHTPWKKGKGRTPSPGTGPYSDHTKAYDPTLGGNGHYAYMEASKIPNNQYCFQTTIFTVERCMTFWYHMWGHRNMQLRIGSVNEVGKGKLLLEITGDHGNRWRQQSVTVNEEGNDHRYRVAFCGKRVDWKNDIAVDDISFTDGPCQENGSKRSADDVNSKTGENFNYVEDLFNEKGADADGSEGGTADFIAESGEI